MDQGVVVHRVVVGLVPSAVHHATRWWNEVKAFRTLLPRTPYWYIDSLLEHDPQELTQKKSVSFGAVVLTGVQPRSHFESKMRALGAL